MITADERTELLKGLSENKALVSYLDEILTELKDFTTLDNYENLEVKLRGRAEAVRIIEDKLTLPIMALSSKRSDSKPNTFK